MKELIQLITNVVYTPKQAMQQVVEEQKMSTALLVYLLVGIFSFSSQLMGKGSEATFLLGGLPLCILMSFCFLFFWSAFLHLAAEFVGGKGRAIDLFSALAVASVPYILSAPLAFFEQTGFVPLQVVAGILHVLLVIWGCYLNVLAIQVVENISFGKAICLLFLPLIVLLVLIVAAIVFSFLVVSIMGVSSFWHYDFFR